MLCIAQKSTINVADRINSNPNLFFKSTQQMHSLFSDIPEVIENNFYVAISCNYFPKEIQPQLPKFTNTENLSEKDLLIRLTKEGLNKKISDNQNISRNKYLKRIEYELNIIIKMG